RLHLGPDPGIIVGKRARSGILEALTSGRIDIVAASPDVHLLLTPAATRVILVEAREVAVVALVERLVGMGHEAGLTELLKHEIEGALRPLQSARECHVEL